MNEINSLTDVENFLRILDEHCISRNSVMVVSTEATQQIEDYMKEFMQLNGGVATDRTLSNVYKYKGLKIVRK